MRLRRTILVLFTVALFAFALFPVAILLLASGLPNSSFGTNGIPIEALSRIGFPDLSLLWMPANAELWRSLFRTAMVALSAAIVASTLGVLAAYLVTRRQSRRWRRGMQFLALVAYGLPSVFLLMALRPCLVQSGLPPLARVWCLHFIYILPMSVILLLGYAASHSHVLDRSAALDGASWPARLRLAYFSNLWRGHLAVTCIGVLVSWGDLLFSRHMLNSSKLLVDLYVLRYFESDSTFPDYSSAALFALVLMLAAACLSFVIAFTNRRGI